MRRAKTISDTLAVLGKLSVLITRINTIGSFLLRSLGMRSYRKFFGRARRGLDGNPWLWVFIESRIVSSCNCDLHRRVQLSTTYGAPSLNKTEKGTFGWSESVSKSQLDFRSGPNSLCFRFGPVLGTPTPPNEPRTGLRTGFETHAFGRLHVVVDEEAWEGKEGERASKSRNWA